MRFADTPAPTVTALLVRPIDASTQNEHCGINDHKGGKEIGSNPEAGPIGRNPAAKRFPFVGTRNHFAIKPRAGYKCILRDTKSMDEAGTTDS